MDSSTKTEKALIGSQYEMIKDTIEFIPSAKENFWPMLKSNLLQWRLNKTPLWNIPLRNWLLRHLIASIDGTACFVQIPFYIVDGNRTHIGKNFCANHGCIIYDHGGVKIGDDVFLGPNVIITTVSHSMNAHERNFFHCENSFEPHQRADIELCSPITIGNNVWVASGSIICPGVKVGDNAVIGAGSVVTRDIPPNVFACGIPCQIARALDPIDREEQYCENLSSIIKHDMTRPT